MKKILCSVISLIMAVVATASNDDFARARVLYDNGLYAQAMDILQSLPQYGKDAMVDGYVTLCAQKQHTEGYQKIVDSYCRRYSSCSLCVDIRKEMAFDLFDQARYPEALEIFESVPLAYYPKKQRPEYLFKKGYCHYMLGNGSQAAAEFSKVDKMEMNDYSAPSQYLLGYMDYVKGGFKEALACFEKSVRDERFAAISNYYIINCNFELKNYGYVIDKGVELFENDKTPAERKAHLARIISESYLVTGNKEMARKFYSQSEDGSAAKTRADYFYAGSLMYATGEYRQAVENFGKMQEKTDSLGQIAWYQTALSYLGLKNKVAALDAFKNASALLYDLKITEDAYFNYAKLAFDLNGDTSVFGEYIAKYSDKVRGEKIYSYMALAALSDRDYQSAIDAYDKIDVLEGQEKNNYVHANYLRGAELLENGSYRKAAGNFKAVTYYTPKDDLVNQLARYGLAESCYRNSQYSDARSHFSDLYNNSALYGLEEGEGLAYDIAYTYFKENDYANASRWFASYMDNGGKTNYKDAMLRYADCAFARKEYAQAADRYQAYVDRYYDLNDVYPYYQAAVCLGLAVNDIPKSKKKEADAMINRKIALLSKVRAAEPESAFYPEAMLELGRTLHERKRTEEALAVFDELVRRAPAGAATAQAMLETGTLKRNAKDIEGALAAYRTVVEQMSSTGMAEDALLAIESIYQSQNAPQKYLEYLDSIGKGATKTEAEKEEMFFTAASQLYFSDNYAKAVTAFEDFIKEYPESAKKAEAWYYIGECYRLSDDKEHACDAYLKLLDMEPGTHTVNAMLRYADLSFSMENYSEAYRYYALLAQKDGESGAVRFKGLTGAMRSAAGAKDYQAAADMAAAVMNAEECTQETKDEAGLVRAKSLLAMSRREEAYEAFAQVAGNPKSEQGAEASYMIIQDCYDRADFDAVKEKTYALADSGTTHNYYLAKAFIVLGDSFVEQGKLKQAEATFRSVADGFNDNEEINSEIQVRLQKLEEMK